MKSSFKKIISLLLIFTFAPLNFFAEDNSSSIDIPLWLKDFRRTEIITFGSLPFVTIWTSLGYGFLTYGEFQNPLDKSNSNYTESDQKKIITIAALTSIGLGLTDLVINLISRKVQSSKEKKVERAINVIPLSEELRDFESYSKNFEEETPDKDEIFPQNKNEYLIKGLENAFF